MGHGKSLAVSIILLLSSMPAAAALSFVQAVPTPLVTVASGKGAVALATADFNGDGKPDLGVVYFDDLGQGAGTQNFVAVMLGNGDGSFQAPTTIYTLPQGLSAILARDFDRDGKIDLAVGVPGSLQILWFKGHGDGTFDAPLSTSTNHAAHGLQTADLNHDGILDLVALDSQDASVSVLLGVGNGNFQAPTDYSVGTNPLDLAIGDVDGMNGPDIVVGNYDAATVGVLLNRGDGTFAPMTSFTANMSPLGLYLADFDGDGKLDVVAGGENCNGGNVDARGCMVFMKGDGAGNFAVPTDADFTGLDKTPFRRHQVENGALDLNNDGKPDVIFVLTPALAPTLGDSQVMVGLSNGDGTFSVSYWVGAFLQPPDNPDVVTAIAALPGDFDQDRVLDLAVATQGKSFLFGSSLKPLTRGGVSILFGDTPGMFEAPRSYAANYKGFATPLRGGVLGDFTGRGKIDLVVLDALTDGVVASPMLDIFRGNGDGSFQNAMTALPWPAGQSRADFTLRAADLDGNGTLDVVFSGPPGGIVASGNGDGTFTNFSSFGFAAGSPANMAIADFDGDGFPDVAVFESQGCVSGKAVQNIEVFLQGAGGTKTFASKSMTPVDSPCGGNWAMAAGDFDKDGKIDLVVTRADGTANDVLVLKGNGDGTFATPKKIGTYGELSGMCDSTVADLRKNGNLDLIGISAPFLFVQLGNGDGTFQPPAGYGLAAGGYTGQCGVKVADFDGDGILDIAVVTNAGAVPFCCIVGGAFEVLRGKGDGTFEPPVKFAIGFSGGIWLDVADVNGDGKPDVVVGRVGANGNGYTVLINNSTPPPVADLAISKGDSPDPLTAGSLTYTIIVTNNGPNAATGVTMTDPLPATLTFVSATPSQGNCSGTATVTCNLGTLSNGGAATVTIVVTPTRAGIVINTATVAANEADPDISNNSASQRTTIAIGALPDLTGSWQSAAQTCRTKHGVTTCSIKGNLKVVNQGTGTAAACVVRLYLSDDATLSADDVPVGQINLRDLQAGGQRLTKVKASLSAGSSASGKFLIAVLDADGVVVETNESNNSVATARFP